MTRIELQAAALMADDAIATPVTAVTLRLGSHGAELWVDGLRVLRGGTWHMTHGHMQQGQPANADARARPPVPLDTDDCRLVCRFYTPEDVSSLEALRRLNDAAAPVAVRVVDADDTALFEGRLVEPIEQVAPIVRVTVRRVVRPAPAFVGVA